MVSLWLESSCLHISWWCCSNISVSSWSQVQRTLSILSILMFPKSFSQSSGFSSSAHNLWSCALSIECSLFCWGKVVVEYVHLLFTQISSHFRRLLVAEEVLYLPKWKQCHKSFAGVEEFQHSQAESTWEVENMDRCIGRRVRGFMKEGEKSSFSSIIFLWFIMGGKWIGIKSIKRREKETEGV